MDALRDGLQRHGLFAMPPSPRRLLMRFPIGLGTLTAAMLLAFWGCATAPAPPFPPPGYPKPYKALGQWYQPLPEAKGFREYGRASWYGEDFHGRRTSSGEIYNMYAMTAAHKTLPLGTQVRVSRPDDGRRVVVRINDRGPFVRGRVIDLSYAAAKELGIVGPGTADVEVVALAAPLPDSYRKAGVDVTSGNFTFQVGAFASLENAERLRAELHRRYPNVHITRFDRGDRIFYRVRLGKCTNLAEAAAYEKYLIANGFPDAFAVAE